MGKIVAVPHFNRDTVEFAWIKSRDQNTVSFSQNHYGRERFGEFSRSHTGLRCLLLFIIWISLSRFGDDRRCYLADFKRRFPASQKILCTVWFICIFFISKWKRSVVYTWICLTKKKFSDGLYYRQFKEGEREQTARSKIVSHNNFAFYRKVYMILQVPVCNPYAQINLLSGKGKTDRKSRTAAAQSEFHRSYSRRNKQWNKPRSCLCGHWSERSISILL